MKKKIIGVAIMAAIALGAGWNVMQSENEITLSDLALVNTEALASSECWTHGECCSSNGDYEFCGYCFGFYMQGC